MEFFRVLPFGQPRPHGAARASRTARAHYMTGM